MYLVCRFATISLILHASIRRYKHFAITNIHRRKCSDTNIQILSGQEWERYNTMKCKVVWFSWEIFSECNYITQPRPVMLRIQFSCEVIRRSAITPEGYNFPVKWSEDQQSPNGCLGTQRSCQWKVSYVCLLPLVTAPMKRNRVLPPCLSKGQRKRTLTLTSSRFMTVLYRDDPDYA